MNKQLAITADAYRSLKERLEFTHNEMGRLLGVTGRMSKNWARHGIAPSSAAVLADWIGLHLDGGNVDAAIEQAVAAARQTGSVDAKGKAGQAFTKVPKGRQPRLIPDRE